APEADLIGVRIAVDGAMVNAYLLNAICGWIDEVAGERPAVVSCSFGGHDGGHDGQRIAERQLNCRFPLDRKGPAICMAAGNEGAVTLHAEVAFKGKDAKGVLKWVSWSSDEEELAVYVEAGAPDDLKIDGLGAVTERRRYVHALSGACVVELAVPPG